MKRRTREERQEIVASFRRSGLTQVAFAHERRMSIGTLQSWIYRPEGQGRRRGAGGSRFVEVETAPGGAKGEVVLHVGSHLVVEVGDLPAAEYLAELSKALEC